MRDDLTVSVTVSVFRARMHVEKRLLDGTASKGSI